MIVSIVDIGSNTIRHSIYQVVGKKINLLMKQKYMTGLVNYINGGELSEQGFKSLIGVINECLIVIEGFNIDKSHFFATAPFRMLIDDKELISRIKELTSVQIKVLEGKKEAQLAAVGANYRLKIKDGICIDIGGASTEIVFFRKKGIVGMHSLDIGCLSLRLKHVKGYMATNEELKRVRDHIRCELEAVEIKAEKEKVLYGIGGTIRNLGKIVSDLWPENEETYKLSKKKIKKVENMLRAKDNIALESLYRIAPERNHTILTGIMILREVMRKFHPEKVIISKYGVREGYIIDKYFS